MLASSMDNLMICELQQKFGFQNICDVSLNQDRITRAPQDYLYDQLLSSNPSINIFDPSVYMHNSGEVNYDDAEGNHVYWDQHHITQEFSRTLSVMFKEFLISNNIISL